MRHSTGSSSWRCCRRPWSLRPSTDAGSACSNITAGGRAMRVTASIVAGVMAAGLSVVPQAQTARPVFQDNYVEANGQRLHYASVGKGPLVLFLHGYPAFWYQWKDQMAEMGRDHLAVG